VEKRLQGNEEGNTGVNGARFGTDRVLPPFGKSDHATIFLLPEYKQRILRETVVTREVKHVPIQLQ